MCGIAGLVAAPRATIAPAQLAAASAALSHRGPDDFGALVWDGEGVPRLGGMPAEIHGGRVGLVHRRLSILDPTPAGWQPMATRDGRLLAVYNGEIYNFLELRAELERDGAEFVSASDTEVMLAAWRRWGSDALNRFIGMFAFALLDLSARHLILARDSFGVKPLYWTHADGGIAFASEIKGLRAFARNPLRVNARALADYALTGLTDVDDATLFQDIWRIPAGHFAIIPVDDPANIRLVRYHEWQEGAAEPLAFEEAAGEVRRRFLNSVALHLRSDVPVGVALSGGIDSAAVLAAARAVLGAKAEIHAFTYVSDDPRTNEEVYADAVAASAGAVHHKVRLRASDLHGDLDELIACQDEPFVSTSIYAQFAVYRSARAQGIKVVLDGQGADEMLGGYPVFQAARLADLLRLGQAAAAWQLAANLPAGTLPWMTARAAAMLVPTWAARSLAAVTNRLAIPSWLNLEWLRSLGADDDLRRFVGGATSLAELREETFTRTSLPALLRYNDRNGMHFGVESRVPFLGQDFVRFLASLPAALLVGRDAATKNVFRRAMSGLVPEKILSRRDKIGFVTPEQEWLLGRADWVEGILGGERARAVPIFDHHAMMKQWGDMRARRRRINSSLWRWINIVRWAEIFDVEFPTEGLAGQRLSKEMTSAPIVGGLQ